WDAGSGVYSDAGTTPAAPDALVQQWNDLSGNGHHVAQATEADRPVFRASVASLNGRPGVEFVSSDYLVRTVAAGIIANLTVHNLFAVFSTVSTATTSLTLYSEGNNANNTPMAYMHFNTSVQGRIRYFQRDDANASVAPTFSDTDANNGQPHVMIVRRLAADSWSLRYDGVDVVTASTSIGTTTIDRLTIGALGRVGNTEFMIGHIAAIGMYAADNF